MRCMKVVLPEPAMPMHMIAVGTLLLAAATEGVVEEAILHRTLGRGLRSLTEKLVVEPQSSGGGFRVARCLRDVLGDHVVYLREESVA